MFDPEVFTSRRAGLKSLMKDGIAIFPANNESPMNYPDNTYHYRQDSNFLYYFGLDQSGLAGVIDFNSGEEMLFGDDLSIDSIIWMGHLPGMSSLAGQIGVKDVRPLARLQDTLSAAISGGRKIHYLPPYRSDTLLELEALLNIPHQQVKENPSVDLIKAVVEMRSIKEDVEILEIEKAVDITCEMHTTVMRMAQPGTYEREIAGRIEGIALGYGSCVSFPIILSMNGQTLHNHDHSGLLEKGRMVVTDAGAETVLHYAGDITRTVPVGGVFNSRQKEIYEIVLEAEVSSIESIKPGIPYMDVHLDAARIITRGLQEVGLMKGDVDEAVVAGAHALFFPQGLGEEHVGYNEEFRRSSQFGTAYLRMGKRIQNGHVLTVEPGIYFIPALIEQWKSDGKFKEFINYDRIIDYMDIGGIRIEDDIFVTESGCRVLGKPIPKTVQEIEEIMKPV